MCFASALRAFRATLVSAGLLLLGACAVALGPAYKVEKQQIEVGFVPGPTLHLAVRVSYQLKNTGNQTLTSLELSLPEARASGRGSPQFWLDAREVPAQDVAGLQAGTFRIPINPPWLQKQKREIAVAFDLAAGAAATSDLAIETDAFYLGPRGWAPVLHAPRGSFTAGGERPDPAEVTVRVPQEFRVHASGRAAGVRKRNGEAEYRFLVRKKDYDPFVVAGRYHELPVHAGDATIIFWTLQPLPAEQAQRGGGRLAATLHTYETLLGPRAKKLRPVWVVQWPAAEGAALPEVVLQGGTWTFDEAFFSEADVRLASTWFLHLVRPVPDSVFLADALSYYAAFVAAESRGGTEQRHRVVASLLSRYDDARAHSKERPLSSMARADSAGQWQPGSIEARLFLFALEDRCGKQAMQRSLARVLRAQRAKQWALEDFRSALEAETGQDLGEFFRVWLNRSGVPADFRARYQDTMQSK